MACEWIGWCALNPEQQAAWFQGIASFGAILIAIAVPATQHYLSEKSRKQEGVLRARSMAMLLLRDFQGLGDTLNKVWAHEHQDTLPDRPVLGPHTGAAMTLPPRLASMADRLHELGPAGAAAQRCVYHLGRAGEYLTKNPLGQELVFDKSSFYGHLWEATSACTAVLNAIDDMFRRNPQG